MRLSEGTTKRIHVPMTHPLSPAAQAVIKKVQATLPDYMISDRTAGFFAAAAIRAAADQVVPVTPAPNDTFCCPPVATIVWKRLACVRAELLAIATELEAL